MRVLAAPGLTPERRLAMQEAFGIPPLADYGLSEVPGPRRARACTSRRRRCSRPRAARTTAPRSASSTATARRCPPAQVGDVVVNGPSRFLFFLGNDELTRDSLTSWGGYRTGDLGYLDEDGHLVYVGPQQGHHPARWRDGRAGRARAGADCATLRSTRPRSSRCPTSASESARAPRSSSSPGSARRRSPSCRQFLEREGVAKYMWPESIEVFDEFPRTPSLKVVKREVVQQIVSRSGVPTPV